jgi:hypothetical protein
MISDFLESRRLASRYVVRRVPERRRPLVDGFPDAIDAANRLVLGE